MCHTSPTSNPTRHFSFLIIRTAVVEASPAQSPANGLTGLSISGTGMGEPTPDSRVLIRNELQQSVQHTVHCSLVLLELLRHKPPSSSSTVCQRLHCPTQLMRVLLVCLDGGKQFIQLRVAPLLVAHLVVSKACGSDM